MQCDTEDSSRRWVLPFRSLFGGCSARVERPNNFKCHVKLCEWISILALFKLVLHYRV